MPIGRPNPAGSGASPGATEDPPSDAISEGSIIAGRYRVLALLGEGTTGAVYRVEHVHIRKIFALKLLHAKLCGHQQVIARFEREAIAAASIEHANVVHATDFGSLPDGSFFLVLEFVDGRDLRAELAEGSLEMARAIHIMRGVVAGVRAAHEKGIIHRDLKPENIMLIERDGTRDFVKLLDFGIARMESPITGSGMQPLTIVGTPVGTPDYMSPEQIRGKSIDARSDLYSLGVIFFELLTGSCPFTGNLVALFQQHLSSEPPELPAEVAAQNPALARIVRRLLAKAPENRFQTAAELAQAMDDPALGIEPTRHESQAKASVGGLLIAPPASAGYAPPPPSPRTAQPAPAAIGLGFAPPNAVPARPASPAPGLDLPAAPALFGGIAASPNPARAAATPPLAFEPTALDVHPDRRFRRRMMIAAGCGVAMLALLILFLV